MEWKISHEMIPVTEVVLDEVQEQDFAQGFVLPDYEPEIFRVISCEADAQVTDYKYSAGKLTYELCVHIRVIYSGENGTLLSSVSQTVNSSRTVDIPEGSGLTFSFYPRTDYRNCRAAGKRRLDVRGAVSVRIRACAQRMQQLISNIEDGDPAHRSGVQLQQKQITALSQMKRAVRNLSLNEETELSADRPPVQTILRCSARAVQGECSIIAGKLVARGEIEADILYRAAEGAGAGIEALHMTLCPYSQIIDIDDIDETCTGMAEAQVTEFAVKPMTDSKGGMRTLSCTAAVRLVCTVCRTRTLRIVTDAYSTKYKCRCRGEGLRISGEPFRLEESFACSADIRAGENPPELIHDLRCSMRNVSLEAIPAQGKIRVCGMLCASVLAGDSEGNVFLTEREEAFEELVPISVRSEEMLVFAGAEPSHCSYHLGADGSLSIKCNVLLSGMAYPETRAEGLIEAELLPDEAPERDSSCALRIYYGTEGERVWDIAKRAGTRVAAVMEENDLTSDVLQKSGMLLIPVVY